MLRDTADTEDGPALLLKLSTLLTKSQEIDL